MLLANIRTLLYFLLQRGLVHAGFIVAPNWAAERVARLFMRPHRRPAEPRPRCASDATPLTVEIPTGPVPTHPVAAWLYGQAKNPDGETILLVHGWEDDHLSWAPFADRLVQHGYRVLTLDQPGHGRSPGRAVPMPVQSAAIAAVGRKAGDMGLPPFTAVIAHSLGGTVALIAATELGLQAKRFAVLSSPSHPGLFLEMLMTALGLNSAQKTASHAALERLIHCTLDSLYLPPKLRSFATPGLILHSRDDRYVPLHHSEENAEAWVHAEFHVLDGLGHRRMMSDPSVHDMLLEFVTAGMPLGATGLRTKAAE